MSNGPVFPSPEQQAELARFPQALRTLVEAELAAGNSIVEVGHSHPAPPAGAYCKLASKVSTRPRASGDGLKFYERNSSIYSGEFTDAERFYFVLEPPNPPPPEPDMDAIRKAFAPKPDPLVTLAHRRAGLIPDRKEAGGAMTETPTGRTHLLHFDDARPPHEVQFALERELMALFRVVPVEDGSAWKWRARATVIGAHYDFELCFLAALPSRNCYSLRTEVSWANQAASNHDYFRRTSAGWIEMWTRELTPARPPKAGAAPPPAERYRALCQAALQAEAHLDSIAAVQQAVIDGLKRGGRFSTSHKEGGTNIYWRLDHFVRSDYGDYPGLVEYADEAEFLNALRQFCHWDVIRHVTNAQLTELEVWKLILRRMYFD